MITLNLTKTEITMIISALSLVESEGVEFMTKKLRSNIESQTGETSSPQMVESYMDSVLSK